jgi:chemotaxis receptor (MCP) glutamine deamidase CheD/CheY-like chemotaxis protein
MPEQRFILPGELCVDKEPVEIATLLGSCVAVCLFNKKYSFGGMNHYMLSQARADERPSGKHGDHSIRTLIKMMLSYDADSRNLQAQVFGGGNVTEALAQGVSIGANNIVIARTVLDEHKIPIVKRDVGGQHGRKIHFENWTGNVTVRRIEKSAANTEIDRKKVALRGRRTKVLVVDDSPIVRNIISTSLAQDPSIEVVGCAENPYQAREMLLEFDPDVICLDIIMPKMDGITFLKKLFVAMPKPVIIISTVAQEGSKLREQAYAIGAVDVIDKEDLALYQGMDKVKSILVSKIKAAATVFLQKKTAAELEHI